MSDRKTNAIHDFLRLASTDEFLCRAGTFLMRRSLRTALWTAGITSSGYLSNYFGLPGFTALQAVVAPLVVGGGMLGIGAGMKYIPTSISSKLATMAAASDLNLMEDFRKSQMVEHLNSLWDKVFWYESDVQFSCEQREAEREQMQQARRNLTDALANCQGDVLERLGAGGDEGMEELVTAVVTARSLAGNLEKSREGFLASAIYAITHALAQPSQTHEIGFNLGFYEDFCDGAYFDTSDVKLCQQYAGSTMLAAIRDQVGQSRLHALTQLPARISQKFWFYLVTRKIATGIARAVKTLNDKYDTEAFNAQVLLWPGEERAEWLAGWAGASEEILRLRKSLVTAALGQTRENAFAVLDRMLLACFVRATNLRMHYDAEYCDGSLDYIAEDTGESLSNNLVSDLTRYLNKPRILGRAHTWADGTKGVMAALAGYVADSGNGGIFNDPVALRAVKITVHTNHNGLRTMFERNDRRNQRAQIDRAIADVMQKKDVYTTRLVGLRLHHQLTILQIEGYRDLACRLAYD